jgi:hypothetical protein
MNHYKISNYVYKITPEELPGHRLLIDGRSGFRYLRHSAFVRWRTSTSSLSRVWSQSPKATNIKA